ncbi:MAG: hypothetical protein ACJAZ2_001216 [Glaciecola sp.]|jgi:hypothetical protein
MRKIILLLCFVLIKTIGLAQVKISPTSYIACEGELSATFSADVIGGTWSSPTGSIDPITGVFNTAGSLSGEHDIFYSVTVGANTYKDTAKATVVANDNINPIPDTAFCDGSYIIITATGSFSSVSWSNGQSGNTAVFSQAGTYNIISQGLCPVARSFKIVKSPSILIPTYSNMHVTCVDSNSISIPSNINVKDSIYSYLWNDGTTDPNRTLTQYGKYYMTITNSYGCTFHDSIEVHQWKIDLDLGSDTNICGDFPQLDAGNSCLSNCNYLWNTGDTTRTITPTNVGMYFVTVKDSSCYAYDTIYITQGQFLTLDLGPDTILCGTSFTINPPLSGGSYLWSNGDTTSSMTITNSGQYSVILNYYGCVAYDTINVTIYPIFDLSLNIKDTSVCINNVVQLKPIISENTIGWTYNWKNSSNLIIGSDSSFAYISNSEQNTPIYLTVTNIEGCSITDTALINTTGSESRIPRNICAFQDSTLKVGDNKTNVIWNDGSKFDSILVNIGSDTTIFVHSQDKTSGCTYKDTFDLAPIFCDSIHRISGKVYWDINKNGVSDPGEWGVSGIKVSLSNPSKSTYTNDWGWFSFNVYESLQTNINVEQKSDHEFTTPNSGQISLSTFGNVPGKSTGHNFGIYGNPSLDELQVYEQIGRLRPGFTSYTGLHFINNSNHTSYNIEGQLKFDTLLNVEDQPYFSTGQGNFISTNDSTISFNIDSIPAKTKYRYHFKILIPAGAEHLGKKMCFNFHAFSSLADIDSSNNSLYACPTIRGSYDPNHKETSLGDGGVTIGTKLLTYNIQFQNTGTDTAFTVKVIDTLDLKYFDLASFEMIGSSHSYELSIDSVGVATWVFNKILLVDSITNEPLSHGLITFNIDLRDDIPMTLGTGKVSDNFNNTANIYFDFNEPIRTNTAVNYFEVPASINEFDIVLSDLFPNPANEIITAKIYSNTLKNVSIIITDVSGKIISQSQVDVTTGENNLIIDVSFLTDGTYFIQIGDNSSVAKFIKQ